MAVKDFIFREHSLDWKIKKAGVSMVQVQVFLKGGVGRGGAGAFPIWFFQGLSFLHLKITLPFAKLHYAFEEKLFFSATMILGKKVILSC